MRIQKLKQKDMKKAIQFAIKGMHFEMFLKNNFLRKLYGMYSWYLQYSRATQVIAAYAGDTLRGVMLVDMNGEKHKKLTFWKRMYVKTFEFLQKLFFKGSAGVYEMANKEMLDKLKRLYDIDGEIVFLVSDTETTTRGIGTMMLDELKKREVGKRVYLYTDEFCSYQFYEHRGFDRVGEKKIELDIESRKVPMLCMLYSKVL